MKRILIIEDEKRMREGLKRALEDLGEVTLCAPTDGPMPTKEQAIQMIQQADLILLDNNLGRKEYCGEDLIPYCKGKAVIGISIVCFTHRTFGEKRLVASDDPEAIGELRNMVLKALG